MPGSDDGRGRMGGPEIGPGGHCTCPSCRATVPETRGRPCYQTPCPKCGTLMIRARESGREV
ncbi:MAG: hypothetical protein QF415_08645 [Candidatus Undinarchaeales archaeon]|nr:hypothetical protein [Candidatus Undinarchaeales archaeon]